MTSCPIRFERFNSRFGLKRDGLTEDLPKNTLLLESSIGGNGISRNKGSFPCLMASRFSFVICAFKELELSKPKEPKFPIPRELSGKGFSKGIFADRSDGPAEGSS